MISDNRTVVVNRHFEKYDIYIGSGTKWGNPFNRWEEGLERCIELYKIYVKNNPDLLNSLDELKGKRLGCSCKPAPCHGDVLVELIEEKEFK